MNTRGHIVPAAVVRELKARVRNIDPSTVYRTLTLLDEVGVLAHSHSEAGIEYHHAASADHVHLTCAGCGLELSLREDEVAPLRRALEKTHGFHPDLTHFAISGMCRSCYESQTR